MRFYRVGQVWNLLRRTLSEEDCCWVREQLTAPQQALFFAQQRGDQVHAVAVARALLKQGYNESRLIQAALLHDVGKAPGVSLPYRTMLVLLNRFAPRLLARLSPGSHGWLAPLARAYYHPELGAELARRAGSEADVVALIRHHQGVGEGADPGLKGLLATFKAIDDAH